MKGASLRVPPIKPSKHSALGRQPPAAASRRQPARGRAGAAAESSCHCHYSVLLPVALQ
jgi:hypothetical protein